MSPSKVSEPSFARAVGVPAVVLALLTILGVPAPVPAAASGECPDPGPALPVILVHGFSSSSDSMQAFAETLEDVGIDAYVDFFDYRNYSTEWVDHEEIGPALRARVTCLSEASMVADGPGRVAIIGHSMGGLATRLALTEPGSTGLSDEVAMVATLGTPHEGSLLAGPAVGADGMDGRFRSALRSAYEHISNLPLVPHVDNPAGRALAVGSAELAALAEFPDGTPVFASAGQFVAQPRFLFFAPEALSFGIGDSVVSVASATSRHHEAAGLGGVGTVVCQTEVPVSLRLSDMVVALGWTLLTDPTFIDCFHTRLPQSQRHVTPIVDQLIIAAEQPARRPALQPAENSIIADRWGPWGPDQPLGNDGATGSGCSPGTPETLPDGVWFGFVADLTATTADFDLACLYLGEEAYARGADPEGADIWLENVSPALRTLPVANDARFFLHANPVHVVEPVDRVGFGTGEVSAFWAHVDQRPTGELWSEFVGVWVLVEDGELVEILEFWYGFVS